MRDDVERALESIDPKDAKRIRKDHAGFDALDGHETVLSAVPIRSHILPGTRTFVGGPLVLTSERLVQLGLRHKDPEVYLTEAPLRNVRIISYRQEGILRKKEGELLVDMAGTKVLFYLSAASSEAFMQELSAALGRATTQR